MKKQYSFKLIVPAILFGMGLTVPAFAQSNDPNASGGASQVMHQTGQKMKQVGSDTAAAASNAYHGTRRAIEDATITTKVKAALEQDKSIQRARDIHVDTVAGIVTLKGSVASPETAGHAAEVAARGDGVKSVNNQLVVVSSSARND